MIRHDTIRYDVIVYGHGLKNKYKHFKFVHIECDGIWPGADTHTHKYGIHVHKHIVVASKTKRKTKYEHSPKST